MKNYIHFQAVKEINEITTHVTADFNDAHCMAAVVIELEKQVLNLLEQLPPENKIKVCMKLLELRKEALDNAMGEL